MAPDALHKIQIDISDFAASIALSNGYRYAFVAIDVFTNYMWTVAIKDRRPAEHVRAMKEVLHKHCVSKQVMGDGEGAWSSIAFTRLFNSHQI